MIPKRPGFSGGPGAVELVARVSDIDLDSGTLQGGKFWRFTPMVKWHLIEYLGHLQHISDKVQWNRHPTDGKRPQPKPGRPADADKNCNVLSLPFAVGPNGRIGKVRDDASSHDSA